MIGRKDKAKERAAGEGATEAAGDTREAERQWARIEASLEQALARLALLGFEHDPELDDALGNLRTAIREGQEPARVAELAREVDATIRKLGLPRAQRQQTAQPRALLLDILNRVGFPRRLAADVRDLRRRLRDPDQAGNLEHLARDLAELVQEAHKEPGRAGLKGLLGGGRPDGPLRALLNRLKVPEPHQDAVADIHARVEESRDVRDLSDLATELAGRLNAALAGEGGGLVGSDGSCAPEMTRPIHRLLDALGDTSDELRTEADRLRNRLYAEPAPDELPALLGGVADLSGRAREHYERERQDLEAFLQQMAQNLGEIGQHFQSARERQADASQQTRRHSDDIREQMEGLANDVRSSKDLEGLKQSVQGRMEVIRQRVEAVDRNEAQREQDLEQQVTTLTSRLEELETESQQLRDQLREKWRQAHTDALTGLPNRLGYEERGAQAVAHWRRHGQALALVVVDVDHFKQINDSFGHQAGDKALQVIAELLQRQLKRETDFLARYGGEEFVALLPETGAEEAMQVAERMRRAVASARFTFRGQRAEISLSAGVADFGPDDTLESVFHRADQTVLLAKQEGRDRVRHAAGEPRPSAPGASQPSP
jgi:diguanylate cyclase